MGNQQSFGEAARAAERSKSSRKKQTSSEHQ